MSVTIDSNGVALVGDGFGENWARKRLKAAPATAKKMQFVYRAWIDSTTGEEDLAASWDSCGFFGLGFDETMYDFTGSLPVTPANFLGIMNRWPPNTVADGSGTSFPNDKILDYYFNGTNVNTVGLGGTDTRIQRISLFDGTGNVIRSVDVFDSTAQANYHLGFAPDPTQGALMTQFWQVWSGVNDKTVYLQMFWDNSGAAEGDDMFDVIDGATLGTSNRTQLYQVALHGDVVSNWINADGTMNFPRWLKFKYPYPSETLLLNYFKVRYFDISENVIG